MENNQKKNRFSKPNPEPGHNSLARLAGLGFELLAINLAFIWGGYALDQYWRFSFPWLTITGVLFATVGTFYYLFKRLNQE